MSGNPSPVAKPAKTMSSRLLTMKFMQRAAASASTAQPQTPSVDDPDTPSPKRQRLSAASSPATTPNSDLQAISAAIAAEEQKRAEAIARQAAEAGETEWVLDYAGASPYRTQLPLVLAAESLDAEDEDVDCGGRRSYGNFKRKTKRQSVGQHEAESELLDEDEDPVDFDTADPTQIDSLIKKARAKAAKKAKRKERNNAQTEVKLSQLSSISGGGGQSPLFSRGGKGGRGGGGGGEKYHGGKFANKAKKRSK